MNVCFRRLGYFEKEKYYGSLCMNFGIKSVICAFRSVYAEYSDCFEECMDMYVFFQIPLRQERTKIFPFFGYLYKIKRKNEGEFIGQ